MLLQKKIYYDIWMKLWKLLIMYCSSFRSVEMEEILDHLGSGNPAIVLVNANLLYCDTCHTKKVNFIVIL